MVFNKKKWVHHQLIGLEFSIWKTQSQDRKKAGEECPVCSAVWDSDKAKDESRKAASGLEPQGKMETCLGEFQVCWEERIQDGS